MPVILVVNKVDRPDARIAEVVDETYELFLDLLDSDADQSALDFPVVYASAKAAGQHWKRPRTANCRTRSISSRSSRRSSSTCRHRRTPRTPRCRRT
jgi:predicted membrane GTPase involved in stress response